MGIAAALTGCAGSSGAEGKEAEKKTPKAPTLSVPKTSNAEEITVRVNGGPLKAGTEVHIGAYGGKFGQNNIECVEEVEGQDVIIDGSRKNQTTMLNIPHQGVYQLVLSAPGYASECGNPDARTRAMTTPTVWLDGDVSTDGEEVTEAKTGEPFDMSVILSEGIPELRPLPVEVNVHGPFESDPELRAAGCKPSDIISSTQMQWDGQKQDGPNPYQTTQLTIDEPGLYLVTARVQQTSQSNPASTECSNYQSVAKVVVTNS
ncbi:hypothetical protein [Arthrobacter pigmenti]